MQEREETCASKRGARRMDDAKQAKIATEAVDGAAAAARRCAALNKWGEGVERMACLPARALRALRRRRATSPHFMRAWYRGRPNWQT